MSGGYTGVGHKTIIPASAFAKISFRLVADQDPGQVMKAFAAWVDDQRCRPGWPGGWPGRAAACAPA